MAPSTITKQTRASSLSPLYSLTPLRNSQRSKQTSFSSLLSCEMDSNKNEVIFNFPPFVRVYKDGRAERILNTEFIPPSVDPSTGVSSKDVLLEPKTDLSARLYLPTVTHPQQNKLPLVIYVHGGGFFIESAFSPTYHSYLNSLVSEASVVAVSVDYRKAPEHHLPIAYEDAWTALQWVVSETQEEEWLNKYADFDRVFMAGDSAGANIVHNVALRAGVCGLKIEGVVLVHPLFSGVEPIGAEVTNLNNVRSGKLFSFACAQTTGADDPFINPAKDPNLSKLGCRRVLVCVAERDTLIVRGRLYSEKLRESGWDGVVAFMESKGEKHVFHLYNPTSERARELMKRVVSFFSS